MIRSLAEYMNVYEYLLRKGSKDPRDLNICVQKTVYFLVHKDTAQRVRYYKTLAGARIAQHSRNARLGFRNRIERVEQFQNWEVELYASNDGTVVEGTYCIQEDTVDQEDLE
jgi:hypothetical protein